MGGKALLPLIGFDPQCVGVQHDWEPIRSMGGPSVTAGLSGAGKPLEQKTVPASHGKPESQRYKNLCTMEESKGRKLCCGCASIGLGCVAVTRLCRSIACV